MVGTTRSRVSHFMNKFRKQGLVDYPGSGAFKDPSHRRDAEAQSNAGIGIVVEPERENMLAHLDLSIKAHHPSSLRKFPSMRRILA
jgi:hypothetical protein